MKYPYHFWGKVRRGLVNQFELVHEDFGKILLPDHSFGIPKLIESRFRVVPTELEVLDIGETVLFNLDLASSNGIGSNRASSWYQESEYSKLVRSNCMYSMWTQWRIDKKPWDQPGIAELGFTPFLDGFMIDPDQSWIQNKGQMVYWFAKRDPGKPWEHWMGPAGYLHFLRDVPSGFEMIDPLDELSDE